MPTNENKPRVLVTAEEEARVARALTLWINTYPDKPVPLIQFERLPSDGKGMSISAIQAAYKTRQYIFGGYEAQYQFKVIYRVYPDDSDSDLAADEQLNKLGAWCETATTFPEVGDAIKVQAVRRDSTSALFAVYDDGARDYQILMTMIYEVI